MGDVLQGDIRRLHVQRIKLAARPGIHHIGEGFLILFMEILLHKFESFVIVRPCGSQNRRNLRMDDNNILYTKGGGVDNRHDLAHNKQRKIYPMGYREV